MKKKQLFKEGDGSLPEVAMDDGGTVICRSFVRQPFHQLVHGIYVVGLAGFVLL